MTRRGMRPSFLLVVSPSLSTYVPRRSRHALDRETVLADRKIQKDYQHYV